MKYLILLLLSQQAVASVDLHCAKNATEASAILARVEVCYICRLNLAIWAGCPMIVINAPAGLDVYADGNLVDPIYTGPLMTEIYLPPDQTTIEFKSQGNHVEKTLFLKPGSVCSHEIQP